MADIFGDIEGAEALLIIGILVGVGYVIYKGVSSIKIPACDPNSLLSKVTGGCPPAGSSGAPPPVNIPGQPQGAGAPKGSYTMVASDDTEYACTGTGGTGSSTDMCTPMKCDANANCTATGTAVPANTLINKFSLSDVVPGTGQTVQDLLNVGYSASDINSLIAEGSSATTPASTSSSPGAPSIPASMSGLGTYVASQITYP